MLKKSVVTILSLILAAAVFAGCGDDGPVTSGVKNGEETVYEVTLSGGTDKELSLDEYRYYIAQTAYMEMYTRNPEFDGNYTAVDWNEKVDGDKTLAQSILEKAKDELLRNAAIVAYGESIGITLTDDEENQGEQMVEQYIEGNGEDALMLELMQMGVTSIDGFKEIYELETALTKVEEEIGTNRSKYIDAELETALKKYKSDAKITAQHVLIMNDSETHADPKATIDTVRERALAGEDFNALMKEFNEDPGQTAGGYTFGKGEMVPEFETAAFALDYGEISEVVPSDYGYHVIKRIVGLAELEAYILETARVEENTAVAATVSVESVMTDVYNAIQKIKGAAE